ncbi:MAG TPA: polynucleotide adenylyltransferase PcnB [Myxococcota bacterium]|nr:polynucleotide adenylyltransferase PcnB [Myxococcota bacterium]HRY95784.1 polynucleotide adenylyltransferase PcnB [Myxococcota bacterium]HSA23666.1 polynucleotide adenylyltransferase PcnB [Myxococcota bacterium]
MSIPTRCITPTQIDPDALKVVRRLQRFGHVAYLVGGCVRDLLLRLTPKDFDVATSAPPQEIRKVFRNCRLIGRRFRLAHIHFQDKIIETATFRAAAEAPQEGELLIRSDNVFGTEQEDAYRRDFTINALFYDPVGRALIDYVGGLEDLVARRLRFIGDPDVRVQEDPVRSLRAVKFAARLGFEIDPATWRAVVRHRQALSLAAPPRLLEEIVRMLRGGAAAESFRLLWMGGLLEVMLPEVARYLGRALERGEERDPGAGLWAHLRALDRSQREGLTSPVLLSVLLLHPVLDAADGGAAAYGLKPGQPVGDVVRALLKPLIERLRLPRWEAERIQQLTVLHRRLCLLNRSQSMPRGLGRRLQLPELLDLFELGVRATGRHRRTLDRLRQLMQPEGGAAAEPSPGAEADDLPEPEPESPEAPAGASGDPPRRRRRRRRRPRPRPVETGVSPGGAA